MDEYEKHPVSKRRRRNYRLLEEEFQLAQTEWLLDEDNIKAYHDMWYYIKLAVFNSLNKALENILHRCDIEEMTIDVTCNIIQSIKNKRARGKEWRIKRLSSAVHLPCLFRFNKDIQFQDSISYFSENYYTTIKDRYINGIICQTGVLEEWKKTTAES